MDDTSQQFLNTVIETARKRVVKIPMGQVLWRAQLDHAWITEWLRNEDGEDIEPLFDVEAPLEPDHMRPLADRAFEGRVNPKGIPCLYCSTDRDNAMAEVRPWIGRLVSVGQFVIQKDLTLIDCALDPSRRRTYWGFGKEPPSEEREANVWWCISRAFAEPVTRNDDVADYAPTQVIAEVFRCNGFDGLVYGSSLGSGHNVALFDLTAAKQNNCYLYRVNKVAFEFEQAANPYFLTDDVTAEPNIEE